MGSGIAERIKKLLALATSANENEAKLASQKALELLVRHNLTMEDIIEKDYTKDTVMDGRRTNVSDKYITRILNRFFFVTCLFTQGWDRTDQKITIFGRPENVEVASYVFDFLTRKFRQLWLRHKKEDPEAYQDTYMCGLHAGFRDKMEETQKGVEGETGLMVVKDPGVYDYMQEETGGTKSVSRSTAIKDHGTFAAGTEAGRDINIQKGVGGKAENRGRRLGS